MPQTTLLDIPQEEQAQMRAALRRARYGSLLALHVLLLCAAGRTPTEIAAVLCCSRSSVYRIVRRLSRRDPGLDSQPGRGADCAGAHCRPEALASPVAGGLAQGVPPCLWLVSDTLELRHTGCAGGHQAWP